MTDRATPSPTDSIDPSSTDPSSTDPRTTAGAPRPKLIEISLPQIVGGALAAATAASLGSRLGVAGTVIGAALASTIAAIASAVYTASLRRTHSGVRSAWHRVARRDRPNRVDQPAGPVPTDADVRVEPVRRRRIHPAGVLVGAIGAFVLAGILVTGVEVLTGRGLDGSTQTTVQQATRAVGARPAVPDTDPTREPTSSEPGAATPASTSQTAADDPEATTTPDPSTSPIPSGPTPSTPTPSTPTSSTAPPADPSGEPSATASSEPSGSENPPAAGGNGSGSESGTDPGAAATP